MNDGLAHTAARLFDAFWSAGISNPGEAVEQVSHLLYLRELDQLQLAWEQGRTPERGPIFSADEQHLRWSHLIRMTPQRMFATVADEVFPWLRRQTFDGVAYSQHIRDARFTIPKPSLLSKAAHLLEETLSAEPHRAGELYECILDQVSGAGRYGAFRTPRQLVDLMVAMTMPGPGDEVYDPACKAGDFLFSAAQYVRQHGTEASTQGAAAARGDRIHGFEIDITMLRVSSMRLMLQGFESTDLRYRDLLHKGETTGDGCASLVLSTPPFAGSVDTGDVAPGLLDVVRTKKAELLHLAAALTLLRPQGRAAVIVPQGVLFGSSKAHIELRRRLVEEHGLEAVVQLPTGTFHPYAGVQTSILFFTKDAGPAEEVWFYEVKSDGWSLDSRRTPLLAEDKLGPTPDSTLDAADHTRNNLPDVLKRWSQRRSSERRRSRSEQSFCVSRKEISEQGYELSLARFRQIQVAQQSAQDGIRLGDFAQVFGGSISTSDIDKESNTEAEIRSRVLTPSALTSTLPDVADLPVRRDARDPRHRLQQGDIVGRDLAGARHWTILPGEYDGVQPGQGLLVVRLTEELLPLEYVAAYMASPLAEEQLPKYGTIPRVRAAGMADIWVPRCDGTAADIRASLSMLEEGEQEAARIQGELQRMRMRIFESGTSSSRRGRLDEAASISSLTAQSLRRQNDPYKLFQESYPYAIARAVRKFRHSRSLAEKHEAAIQCAESLILSLGIMSLALAADRGRVDLSQIDQWKESVARGGVSLGHWVGTFKAVVEDFRQHGDAAAGLVEAAARKKGGKGLIADLDQLIALRNKIRHGAGPRTRAEFEKSLEKIEKLMLSSLSGCAFLATTRWVHAEQLRWLPDTGKFRVSGPSLMGDHPDFAPVAFDTAHPLADDRLYLVTPQEQPVPLTPFCLLSDCPTCLAPELYYPDRLNNSTALLKSLDRGHELESDTVLSALRAWGTP
ncbi:N-6 DNA methylase [Streptomyces sp. NPDC085460]|uniref:class I SAM-dependent DNA methyltransferase n=1 Tax=Streptomyces sp. NPDC085460 TaxID=3365723 RepID=UPI0037D128B6